MRIRKPTFPPGAVVRVKRLVVERRDESRITEIRRTMIGGTDLAPILGVSEKNTRFAVWAAKVNADLTEDNSFEEEAAAGSFLEPFILSRFAKKLGVTVVPTPFTYRLVEAQFLGANPDGIVMKGKQAVAGIDAKSRSPFVRHLWGDAGSGDVPPDEFCQGQWYMEVCDIERWYFAVLFDRQLVIFVLHRDRELGALMRAEATAFWNDFVVPRKEPPFEGPAAADYLRRKHPHAILPPIDASDTDLSLVERREAWKRVIDEAQLKLDAVEGAIKARIGDAEGLHGTGWKATWYETAGRAKTDLKAVLAELRAFPFVSNLKLAAEIHAAIDSAVARYTTPAQPNRILRVTFKGPRAVPNLVTVPATDALVASEGE